MAAGSGVNDCKIGMSKLSLRETQPMPTATIDDRSADSAAGSGPTDEELREAKGEAKQKELGDKHGVTARTVRRWKNSPPGSR